MIVFSYERAELRFSLLWVSAAALLITLLITAVSGGLISTAMGSIALLVILTVQGVL